MLRPPQARCRPEPTAGVGGGPPRPPAVTKPRRGECDLRQGHSESQSPAWECLPRHQQRPLTQGAHCDAAATRKPTTSAYVFAHVSKEIITVFP